MVGMLESRARGIPIYRDDDHRNLKKVNELNSLVRYWKDLSKC